jgi:hypothetical protein
MSYVERKRDVTATSETSKPIRISKFMHWGNIIDIRAKVHRQYACLDPDKSAMKGPQHQSDASHPNPNNSLCSPPNLDKWTNRAPYQHINMEDGFCLTKSCNPLTYFLIEHRKPPLKNFSWRGLTTRPLGLANTALFRTPTVPLIVHLFSCP